MGPPFILHVFPSFAVGGAQARFASVVNRLGRGARHLVMAMDGNLAAQSLIGPEVQVRYQAWTPAGNMLSTWRRMRETLREIEPDLLVTSNWGSMDWAIANQRLPTLPPFVRHVHTEDGFGPDEQGGQLKRRVLTRRLYLRSSEVVLPSRTLMHIAAEVWKLPRWQMHYIPNGVDVARFDPGIGAHIPPGEGPVVGTVAALRPEKNIGRLLRAFASVRARTKCRLVIVGDGAERGALQSLAMELGVAEHVHFAGHTDRPQRYYRVFDIFAMSSDTEQMPLALLEAMAAVLPVAATAVGDVREMVAPENLPFVVERDEAALAAALLSLIGDDTRRKRIGLANRDKAEQDYDQEKMFDAYAWLWRV